MQTLCDIIKVVKEEKHFKSVQEVFDSKLLDPIIIYVIDKMIKKILLFLFIALVVAVGGTFLLGFTPKISNERISEAFNYSKANGLNPDYCIFVDFSAYSGSKRLMLYSFKDDKVLYSCKCAHGNDGSGTIEATKESFSNKSGSHKSSLGKYKIGKKRKINSIDGMFDVSMYNIPCYETHGLEQTNSNAHSRGILIHPDPIMNCLPFPMLPWHSYGCFSIPNSSFNIVSEYIDKSKRPVLLWAYYK